MKMKTWTVDEMLAEKPCEKYTRSVITSLWAGRERLTLQDILGLDISARDRMWVVWRPGALLKEQQKSLLETILVRCITTHALHCGIAKVESWAQKWISNENRSIGEAAGAARAGWAAGAAVAAA